MDIKKNQVYEVEILDNGFKILVLNKQCKFFNFNLGIKIGSAYETDNERGFSHFIEHMLFRSNCKFKDYEVNNIIEFPRVLFTIPYCRLTISFLRNQSPFYFLLKNPSPIRFMWY